MFPRRKAVSWLSAGQPLTYSATLANGQPLPSWLVFRPGNDSFTGVAPMTAQTLRLNVIASDSSGPSASETTAAAASGHTTPGVTAAGGSLYNLYVQPQVNAMQLPHS